MEKEEYLPWPGGAQRWIPRDMPMRRAAARLPGRQKWGSRWGMVCSSTEAQEGPTRQKLGFIAAEAVHSIRLSHARTHG